MKLYNPPAKGIMLREEELEVPHVETFSEDGRIPVEELYEAYETLVEKGWSKELVSTQQEILPDGRVIEWPIYAYKSHPAIKEPTDCLWVLGGVHGEEPASNSAFASHLQTFLQLAELDIPIVFLPMLNPSGYHRDWRYQNEQRSFQEGESVTDAEELLPDPKNPSKPRVPQVPQSPVAKNIIGWMREQIKLYRPYLVLDFHEDEFDVSGEHSRGDYKVQQFQTYLYFAGQLKFLPVAKMVAKILKRYGVDILMNGKTRFEEIIEDGTVPNPIDGSVDEWLAAFREFIHGVMHEKYGSPAVITVETGFYKDQSIPLDWRAKAHGHIIRNILRLWQEMKRLEANDLI